MKHWLIWVSAIAGTILLGALGSGLWEKAIKPLSAWGGQLLLRASLGLFKWSRDSMYVEIARGRRDRSTLLLVRVLVLALFGLAVWSGGQMHSRMTDTTDSKIAKQLHEGTPKEEIVKALQQEREELTFKLDV